MDLAFFCGWLDLMVRARWLPNAFLGACACPANTWLDNSTIFAQVPMVCAIIGLGARLACSTLTMRFASIVADPVLQLAEALILLCLHGCCLGFFCFSPLIGSILRLFFLG